MDLKKGRTTKQFMAAIVYHTVAFLCTVTVLLTIKMNFGLIVAIVALVVWYIADENKDKIDDYIRPRHE